MSKREWVLIHDDDDAIAVDINDVESLVEAMRFKANHIKAKTDPKLFAAVAARLTQQTAALRHENNCDSYNCGYCMCQGPELIKVECEGDKKRCDSFSP